jgi:hypothetical protein
MSKKKRVVKKPNYELLIQQATEWWRRKFKCEPCIHVLPRRQSEGPYVAMHSLDGSQEALFYSFGLAASWRQHGDGYTEEFFDPQCRADAAKQTTISNWIHREKSPEGELHQKMVHAYGMFHDKNGKVFSEKEHKEHQTRRGSR